MRNERKVWDRLSIPYDRIIKSDLKYYEVITNKVKKYTTKETRLLDIATGTGIIALNLFNDCNTIKAVDFSNKMLDKAKKKADKLKASNIEFIQADATYLPFEDKSYDIVTLANALHILPHPNKVLYEAIRVLKDDGVLVIPTFLHASKKSRFMSKVFGISGFKAYSKWNRNSFKNFIKENSLIIIEEEYHKGLFELADIICKKVI